ncbi:MAG TPA: protein-disulfide reductase DsbD domain-containing protein [Rubricoccaceae bacterium]|nr:protein-disulfide reductase DsbD domain-containing protein [Rubricoccaceae bacterium]
MRSLLLLVLVGLAAPARAQADPSPHSEASLIAAVASVQPGQPFDVALRLQMDEGWHSYWQNPGDSGMRTKITWSLPAGFAAGPIRWPYPSRIEVEPFTSYGYHDEVLLLTEITPPANLPLNQPLTLRARAEWLICEEVCLPAEQAVTLTLPVRAGAPAPSAEAGALAAAQSDVPVPVEGWGLRAEGTDAGYALHLTPPPGWTGSLDDALFFAADSAVIEHAPKPAFVTSGNEARLDLPISTFATEPTTRLRGVLVAAEGNVWDAAGRVRAMEVDVPVEGVSLAASAEPARGSLSLLLALAFAFLGGLILNLMPCVFPILSIKILGFAGGRETERATLRTHGLAFGAGVILSFLALAGLLLALRAGGAQLGWGFQLQSPWLVGGLALLMFALGLSLAGVFEVGLGLAGATARLDRREGAGGAFLSGILATLVATPCTAPFMGAALGWALAQPAAAALAVFLVLGLGMALPYVLLSLFPAWLRRLPKPGPWMETLKQALAFPMFLTVVWLVWVFGQQTGMDGVAFLLVAMTTLALGAWVYGRWGHQAATQRGRVVARGLALAALLGAALALGAGTQRAAAASTGTRADGWEAYDEAAVQALVAQGRPVFVDFTAAWCLTCQVNKRVALHDEAVEAAFEAKGVTPFEADWTRRDPAITAALARFGRSGVPVYVLYPGGDTAPVLLPEVLTPSILLDALDRLPDAVASTQAP